MVLEPVARPEFDAQRDSIEIKTSGCDAGALVLIRTKLVSGFDWREAM